MIGIYAIRNKINDRRYIGQSIDIDRRWRAHKASVDKPEFSNYPIYRAIKKHGIENFSFEVLEECSVEELNSKEIYYISKFDSFENGYNQTLGGQNPTYQKLNPNLIEEISNLLRDSLLTNKEIGELFSIGNDTVSMINNGKMHKRDIKYPIRERKEFLCVDCGIKVTYGSDRCVGCYRKASQKVSRPNKEVLIEEVALNGFASTGRKYGVTDKAIRKWMKSNNLPTHINEIKKLYGNYNTNKKDVLKASAPHNSFILFNDNITKRFTGTREAAKWLIDERLTNAKSKVSKHLSGEL